MVIQGGPCLDRGGIYGYNPGPYFLRPTDRRSRPPRNRYGVTGPRDEGEDESGDELAGGGKPQEAPAIGNCHAY